MAAGIGEIIGAFIRWTFILSWRFFTGAHMDGARHTDATFFMDASPRHRKRQQTNGAWKCMSRWRRAKWRNGIFWPCLILTVGFMMWPSFTFFVLGFLSPGLGLIYWHRIRLAFWLPIVAHHSDGTVHQHWVMKPKYRRLVEKFRHPEGKRRRPGLALAKELTPSVHLEDVPADYENAVRAELAEELDGQPFVELKLLMVPDDEEGG